MRRLLLVLLISISPEALAQGLASEPPERSQVRTLGETVLITYGGVATGMAAAVATAQLIEAEGLPSGVGLPIGYAVGVTGFALGVHGTARLLGVEGTLGNALGDAWAGGAIGLVVGGTAILLANEMNSSSGGYGCVFCRSSRSEFAAVVGVTTAVLAPIVWVITDYRDVQPTVLRGLDGTSAPGLSLRIDL